MKLDEARALLDQGHRLAAVLASLNLLAFLAHTALDWPGPSRAPP